MTGEEKGLERSAGRRGSCVRVCECKLMRYSHQVFNPPELAKAKDQKKLAGRLENDIVTATKRCAIDKVKIILASSSGFTAPFVLVKWLCLQVISSIPEHSYIEVLIFAMTFAMLDHHNIDYHA